MYSLVSAAVLAQDLLRHPYAVRLAEAVDRVLALTPEEVVALGPPAPEQVRRRVLEACSAPPRPSPGRPKPETATRQEHVLEVLEGALAGSLDDLQGLLLREEPLRSAPEPARQVALDAVAAAWAGPSASLSDVGVLLHPWEVALPPVGPPLRVGGARLRDLLEEVVRRTPDQWARTVAARADSRGDRRWSAAMHQACRAAWEHGRLQEVARAQLAATRALALTRTGPDPGAAAMAVTAAVQAACTADLLDPETTSTLVSSWEAGS